MAFSAFLFDMDGVVIDTRQSVTEFWLDLAGQHDVQLTDADFTYHIHGTRAMYTLTKFFPHLSQQQYEAILTGLIAYENQQSYTEVKGVTAFLHSLKQQNIQTALVTSAEPHKVRRVLDQLQLDGLFNVVITANDVTVGKPDPQCYLLAAQRLNKMPEQCVVFEDAISGVKAGAAAKMLCIGIQQASGAPALLEVGARYVVPDFSVMRLEAAAAASDTHLTLRVGTEQSLPLIDD